MAAMRKKIEIVVEARFADDVVEWLAERGVKGWTLLPHLSGSGRHGPRGGEISRTFENVMIVAVATAPVADRVLEESVDRLRHVAAVVWLSAVEVARADHF